MKKLPIGISDFKEIIEEDYYYVDKTLLIDELKKTSGKVVLITRPRRFGKTLNLSMLRYFFEINKTSTAYLFEKTQIWNHTKYHDIQGSYPVVFLTFKGIKQTDWPLAYEKIEHSISLEFKRHQDYLMPTLSKYDFAEYEALVEKRASRSVLTNSLFFLTRLLKNHFKKRVIFFLDEYDAPIHAGYTNGYYNQAIEFMRELLTDVLKDNSYLER